jgi:DNA topoisomerase-6 subunit A
MLIAAKCKELVSRGKTASIRELYYQLKHTIADTKENTFEDQGESDPLIVDLETSLGVLREELHLKADDKGTIIGNVTIEDSGDMIDCSKLGRSGLAIPSIVEHYKFHKVSAKYILVIETAAMFDRLVEEQFHVDNNCILMATKGQAARGIRRLIHRLATEKKLPVIMFTDGDPWGYYIYSVIKAGSMALAHESERLGTPSVKFIGMTMTDIEEYGLGKVTEKLKDVDKKRIDELLQYPWFQKKEWRTELLLMAEKGVRIEQQALASKSLEFVAEEYLPQKIKAGKLLP